MGRTSSGAKGAFMLMSFTEKVTYRELLSLIALCSVVAVVLYSGIESTKELPAGNYVIINCTMKKFNLSNESLKVWCFQNFGRFYEWGGSYFCETTGVKDLGVLC